MSLRITLAGYYGCGNLGDEAVLAGILDSFRDRALVGRDRFIVLSADPARTSAVHGAEAVERMRLTALRRALRESDALVLGGGSLLQDATSLRSLLYYLWVARLGLNAHKPLVLYAQGIGPLRRAVSRRLVRALAERAALVTVRDTVSRDLLLHGLRAACTVTVTADPAFCVSEEAESQHEQALAESGVPHGDWVGMAVRPSPGMAAPEEQFATLARAVAESAGMPVVLLPFDSRMDTELSRRVAARASELACVARLPESVPRAMQVVGGARIILGMRLHACILGVARTVPVVSLSYDPKVSSFMQEAGLSAYNVESGVLDVERVCSLVRRALGDREALLPHLRDSLATLRRRAYQNVELTMRALGGEAAAAII